MEQRTSAFIRMIFVNTMLEHFKVATLVVLMVSKHPARRIQRGLHKGCVPRRNSLYGENRADYTRELTAQQAKNQRTRVLFLYIHSFILTEDPGIGHRGQNPSFLLYFLYEV
jgi:hypothetical protein